MIILACIFSLIIGVMIGDGFAAYLVCREFGISFNDTVSWNSIFEDIRKGKQ